VISWFHYVRHQDIPIYKTAGWRFAADLGPTHGAYAVLMIWTGEGIPA